MYKKMFPTSASETEAALGRPFALDFEAIVLENVERGVVDEAG